VLVELGLSNIIKRLTKVKIALLQMKRDISYKHSSLSAKKKSLARTNALMVCEVPNVEGFMLALNGIVIILGETEPETDL
jgi:hypothetical protein